MPLWICKNIEEREITSLGSSDPSPWQSAEHNGVNEELAGSHSKSQWGRCFLSMVKGLRHFLPFNPGPFFFQRTGKALRDSHSDRNCVCCLGTGNSVWVRDGDRVKRDRSYFSTYLFYSFAPIIPFYTHWALSLHQTASSVHHYSLSITTWITPASIIYTLLLCPCIYVPCPQHSNLNLLYFPPNQHPLA